MRWVVIFACSSCAATTSTCPIDTKPVTTEDAGGRAQWCATTDNKLGDAPIGRTYESAVTIGRPAAMPGGVDGPFTSWYPSGTLKSHGSYVDYGARSVPEGLWVFWYPGRQRRTLGAYHRGAPAGCFAVWEADGTRRTGYVEGTELRVAACTPPADDEILIVEGRARAPAAPPAWGDVSLQAFFGPNEMGARNAEQVDPHPFMMAAFNIASRKRLGRLRLGPTVALRLSDNSSYSGYSAGAVVAFQLPQLHRRIDAEVTGELAAHLITVTPARPGLGSADALSFWSALPAAQLNVAVALSPTVEALAAVRAEGFPFRSTDRAPEYCDFFTCSFMRETWHVGGFNVGINVGLRLLIR